jgi:hypothetical protein
MTDRKPTQQTRILAILEQLRDGRLGVPEEYLRRHHSGDGISTRYFKQVMMVSECNGRLSELKARGYNIETSQAKDPHGFVYHRLKGTPMQTPEDWFDALPMHSDRF